MLFAMLPGFFFGPAIGIAAGVAYGILQFIIDPYVLTPVQAILDYVFAFGAFGLSGFFAGPKKKPGNIAKSIEHRVMEPPVGNSNTLIIEVTVASAMHTAQ